MRSRTKNPTILFISTLILVQIGLAPTAGARSQKDQVHFKTEIDFGNGSLFSTFLDVAADGDRFVITSPKNADLRIMGGKARIGRMMGKLPQKGSIVRISGTRKGDSLFGETKIPMFGSLSFRGTVTDGALTGALLNRSGVAIGTLHGIISGEDKVGYDTLYPQLMKTIMENIYSRNELQTAGWKRFEAELGKLCDKAHDDIELYFGFSLLARKLPFTHLSLVITKPDTGDENEDDTAGIPKSVFFEERNSTTAYLKIKNFSSSEAELHAILPRIVSNTAYKNLIIDLRDNGGGGVGPAFALAKYIVSSDQEAGYFLTNKLQYSGFQPELFKTLPPVQPKSTAAFTKDLKTMPGVRLVFRKPQNPVFSGNIYVLTNGNTASTCEPMVYALKAAPNVTVVGERTYGGMLAAAPFFESGKYMLLVPIADFYTYDGVRLDKLGVAPDISVKSEEAEAKALELITGGGKQ